MLVAEQDGARIEANAAERGGIFNCPQCKGILVFKPGRKVISHFAHKPPTDCTWARGETRAHLEAKLLVSEVLKARGLRAELECILQGLSGDRRADVLVWSPSGKQLAIELQHTSIGLDEIERRAFSYAKLGIAQIWVPFISKDTIEGAELRADGSLFLETYSPRQFEKWVHGFHQKDGMWVYAPHQKLFWKAHIAPHQVYVPITEWYDEYGEEQSAGGYTKFSKLYRELTLEGPFPFEALRVTVKSRRPGKVAHYNWPGGGLGMFVVEDVLSQVAA